MDDYNIFTKHGGIPVFGIWISHSWHEIGAVLQTVYEYKVDCFVEIGFHRGGLGTLMVSHCNFDPDFYYLGFDIDKDIVEPSFVMAASKTPNASALFQDALSDHSVNMVQGLVNSARQPMIYCDGGNKPREFDIFSRIIPTGGLIMVHDHPIEFKDEHFEHASWVKPLHKECLEGINRQLLFQRT